MATLSSAAAAARKVRAVSGDVAVAVAVAVAVRFQVSGAARVRQSTISGLTKQSPFHKFRNIR